MLRCIRRMSEGGSRMDRLKRICSSDETLKSSLDDLKGFLMERGYHQSFIHKQFVRVRNCNHTVMQGQQAKKKEDRICLALDFHPALKELFGILHELQSIVGLSQDFLKVLPEKPIISFRRPRNLKDHLVRSKLRNLEYSDRGMNISVARDTVKCVILLYYYGHGVYYNLGN